MNGATEATQADLLATAQAMNVNLIKLQQLFKSLGESSSGGGGSSGMPPGKASAAISAVGVAASVAGAALTAVQVAASAVGTVLGVMGGIVSGLVKTFTNTASALYSFSASTALGTSTLSGFYAAFQNIPIIGRAFGVMSDVLAYQEQLLDFFQQISMQGAGFSGSLSNMRAAASRSYMSMQDFSAVVRENTEVFSNMGGTVMSGVNRFVDIQNRMLGPRSEYGNIMAGLGLTAKGAGSMIAYYMKLQSASSNLSLQTTDQIIKGTIAYAKELDTLSQLTGINNKDLQKKVEKIQSEEAFENFKRNKTTDQIEYMDTVIKNTVATMGEDAAMQVRSAFMGANVVITEGQAALAVMTKGGVTEFAAEIVRMRDQGVKADVAGEFTRRKAVDLFNRSADSITQLGATAGTMAGDILLTSTRTLQQYGKGQADLAKLDTNQRAILERQNKSRQSEAQALERALQGMKDFGNGLLMTVWGVIAPMAPVLQQFARFIASLVIGTAQLAASFTGSGGFKDAVAGVTDWFTKTAADIKAAYNKGGFVGAFGELFKKSVEGIQKIWTQLEPVVVPVVKQAFDGIMKFLQPWFEKALSAVFDSISDYLNDKLGIGESKNARLARQKEQDTGQYKAWLEYMKSATAPMFASGMLDRGNQRELFGEYQAQLKTGNWKYTPPEVNPQVRRHSGTIGMTGNWWEKSNVVAEIQAGESVVTQAQMAQIVGAASQNGLAESIQQLNNLVALQVKYAKETAEYARRNVDATRSLDGNLFARA
jgi:hypothetical protein